MHTLTDLIARYRIDVDKHLDRQVTVPVLTGLQRQGDVIVVPSPAHATAVTVLGADGLPVVRGESGGNTHTLVADGTVFCDPLTPTATALALAVLTVPEGSAAYLAHPEHAYVGIGPGTYVLSRQREQADALRLVAD